MDNENNDLVKQTSKIALNAALSPIKKSILLSLLSILPYLIGAFLIIILFCGIYMSIDEQIDQVANGAGDFGNKVGNAVQLYGFKTETEVEQNEEHRFYNTLNIYKSFYELTDYDTVLIANTLLFEGMYDDKLEFTELTDQNETEFPNLSEDDDSLPKNFLNIVDYIYKSFFNGFSSSYMGSSQYKKANKSLSEPVITLYKCHKLTGFIGITNEDVKQCYRGYLVAEYDYEIDKAIEDGTLETEVKKGYLIFDDFITLSGLNTDLTNTNAGFNQFFKNIFDKLSDFFGNSIDYALFRINPVSWIIGKFYMSQLKKFENFIDRVETAISILIYGKLAEEPNNKPIWNNKHFFYNGYIVRFLKEYYKVSKGSERNIYLERENKLEIANLIIETTDAYTDYVPTAGKSSNNSGVNIAGSNEKNASVIIDDDISISFDDYILLYLLKNYKDKLLEIIDSGVNVEERIRALIIFARTKVYKETGFDNNSVDVNGDKDIYDTGMEIYKDLTNSDYSKYLNDIKEIIKGTYGKKIKVNGKIVDVSEDEISKILSEIINGSNVDDAIKKIIPNASLESVYFPLPNGSYHKSSDYGEMREDGPHKAYDYGAATGTPIYSVSDGVVTDIVNWCTVGNTSCGGGYGNRVYVAYTNGDGHTYYVIYGHMSGINDNLSVGNTVSAGLLLGYVGSTGESSGSHLHLEVRKDSTNNDSYSINPKDIFDLNF